jgi:hypothetical protein
LGAGAVSAIFHRNRARQSPAVMRQKAVGGSLKRTGDQATLFEPRTGSYVPIRDRTDFWSTRIAPAHEVSLFIEKRQKQLASFISQRSVSPPPGGLGAGVSFGPSLLHFAEETDLRDISGPRCSVCVEVTSRV